jgi:hypothetical protein
MRGLRSKHASIDDDSLSWKCDSCGAQNEDSRQSCAGCGDPRPGAIAPPPIAEPETVQDLPEVSGSSTFEDKEEPEEKEAEEEFENADTEPPSGAPSTPTPTTTPQTWQPTFSITPTAESVPQPISKSSPQTIVSGDHYYLVFINTPAQSLIKTRVSVEFEDFPVVTIGRSAENIVVVPDQEVSRKHAQLTMEGSRIMLKDLKSSNGTFVYDGKDFQRVGDSVEVKPNTILKFGSNTIVRLTAE